MPAILEQQLRREALAKGLTGPQQDAYVFGTLSKMNSKNKGGLPTAGGAKHSRRGPDKAKPVGGGKLKLRGLMAGAASSPIAASPGAVV